VTQETGVGGLGRDRRPERGYRVMPGYSGKPETSSEA